MHDDHPPQGRLRVLVVDDNEDAATTWSLLLELAGHRTGTAFNGQEAVTAAAHDRYDVFLFANRPAAARVSAAWRASQASNSAPVAKSMLSPLGTCWMRPDKWPFSGRASRCSRSTYRPAEG